MKEIELFYGLICPYCKTAKAMLKKIMNENPGKFRLKQTLISSPSGMISRYRLGIHAVPAVLMNGEIIFRGLPSEEELRETLGLQKKEKE